jgi:hypothetical protein
MSQQVIWIAIKEIIDNRLNIKSKVDRIVVEEAINVQLNISIKKLFVS